MQHFLFLFLNFPRKQTNGWTFYTFMVAHVCAHMFDHNFRVHAQKTRPNIYNRYLPTPTHIYSVSKGAAPPRPLVIAGSILAIAHIHVYVPDIATINPLLIGPAVLLRVAQNYAPFKGQLQVKRCTINVEQLLPTTPPAVGRSNGPRFKMLSILARSLTCRMHI